MKKGIDVLDNEEGFFMMVEGGKIDWSGHANDARSNIGDVIALDEAVQVAIDFANKHPEETLIIVTGDHETGGMTIGQATTGYNTAFHILQNQNMSYVEFDKLFKVGDKVLVLVEKNEEGNILFVSMLDHYRLDKELLIVFIFMGSLVIFAGTTGIRTIISFIFSLICIWKLLIPSLLKGYHPMLIGLLVGVTMATVTLILVAGFTKKAYCAILGSGIASFMTCIMAMGFGMLFKIDGTVMQWSESLLYAGFENLNLTLIYQASIYLACSGAMIDLAVDISAALDEVIANKLDLSSKEILRSGMIIGRSVVGSQATTLLFAYMGSFIAVMMVYMAQGTPMLSILNSKSVASEVLHTFVGCIGLVIVSPITALICSYVYKKRV